MSPADLLPFIASAALAVSYVGAIKVNEPADVAQLSRDDPRVIRYRLSRVTRLCLTTAAVLPWLLSSVAGYYPTYHAALYQFGLIPGLTPNGDFPTDVLNVLKTFGKMVVLYVGPLVYYAIDSPNVPEYIHDNFLTLQGFRDHIFAPITEEFIYRACVLAILSPVVALTSSLVMYTPLLFGLAHIHHGWHLRSQGMALKSVVLTVLFQLTYTTAFGILANHIFISTGKNLCCLIVLHSMCNLIGFPSMEARHTHPRFFKWHCVLLVVGLFAFSRLL